MMYTSYFANMARILAAGYEDCDFVNVATYPPGWYTGRRHVRSMRLLAPSTELQDYVNANRDADSKIDLEYYQERYYHETLKPLDFMCRKVYYDLLMGSKDTVLLSWEPHYAKLKSRDVVARWFERHIPGIRIQELDV